MRVNPICHALVVWCATLMFCAHVKTTTPVNETKNDHTILETRYEGPKTRIKVIQFDIPQHYLVQYPELAQKNVGFGLCSRLVDGLYETNRFACLEEKDSITQRIFDQWKLSQSGAVSDSTIIEQTGLSAPQYLMYAEVYDFSVGSSEALVGVAASSNTTTRIGIQIRLVDVKNGSFIPASGIGEVAIAKTGTIWALDEKSFDQSTVGKASQFAITTAINQLVRRLPQKTQ